MNITTPITSCLCCDSLAITPIIDFGATPLANTYSVLDEFPLAVNLCHDCYHLQLTHFVSPDILYKDYCYFSGTSKAALRFFDEFADFSLGHMPNARNVLDIACNDGTQLDAFKHRGMIETTGCDPASNLTEITKNKGHKVVTGLFEDQSFDQSFDIITAQNVLAHSPRPLEFLRKAESLMHDESRMFVMTSQADMVTNGECDTIYHEHISYFNLGSMLTLVRRAGLKVLDVHINPMHGNSYIFVIGKNREPAVSVYLRAALEEKRGLGNYNTYLRWARYAQNSIDRFRDRILTHQGRQTPTVGLCAAAKGISMLNMAKVKLDCLFDVTEAKIGKIASGMRIGRFSDIANLPDAPVLMVVLAWNFEREVRENVARYRNNPSDIFITSK